jgi:nitroreductase
LCYAHGITEHNLSAFLTEGGKLDVVIEESDSIDVKFLVREQARARRIPVLMDTSDRGLLDVERFDLEPARPLFHGLAKNLDPRTLAALSNEEKIPHLLDLLGVENLSTRLKASMLEIEQSIMAWPQLASSVFMGGAVAADTARRILLGEAIASGRYYVDLHELIPARIETTPRLVDTAPQQRTHHTDAQLNRVIDALPAEASVNLSRHLVEELVAAGISAPSGGNAQPWRWAYGRDTLLLMRDDERCSFLDVEARGTLAALGAAAENVCLHAATKGLRAQCHTFPLPGDPLRVAALRFFPAAGTQTPSGEAALAANLFERRTDRRLSVRAPLTAAALDAMHAAIATVPGARLEIATSSDALAQLEQILGVTQQLLLQHLPAHRQMMSEIQWDDPEARDTACGIPVEGLTLSALDRAGLDLCRDFEVLRLNRSWGGGAGLREYAEKAVRASSAMALVSVTGRGARAHFDGGRAMQRAWLAATAQQLAVQPLSALPYLFARMRVDPGSLPAWFAQRLIELWPSYARIFRARNDEAGVLLFRLGVPADMLANTPPPSSPRRPVSQVLRFL